MEQKSSHNNISLDKAFRIIEYLSSCSIPQSVAEVSQTLNFNRATTNNLLGTMLNHKYVTKDKYGKYSMSSKLFEIGCTYHQNSPLVQALVQQNFFETHSYNCALGLTVPAHPFKGILLCVQNNMNNFDNIPLVGNTLPLHASGAGKLILAYATDEYRENFYSQCKLFSYTENTITDRKALDEELALSRSRGYAKDTCEVRSGLCCISAPIFNSERELAAAVSITGPKDFITSNESKLIQDVITMGQLITFRIGGVGESPVTASPVTF